MNRHASLVLVLAVIEGCVPTHEVDDLLADARHVDLKSEYGRDGVDVQGTLHARTSATRDVARTRAEFDVPHDSSIALAQTTSGAITYVTVQLAGSRPEDGVVEASFLPDQTTRLTALAMGSKVTARCRVTSVESEASLVVRLHACTLLSPN